MRGADHGLVLEPGVYISRIVPGSPAAKESNLNIGDRVLYVSSNLWTSCAFQYEGCRRKHFFHV